eukprot:CAMPEP_0114414862 /NCGR_PEP_ID=MMETSP0103-20121206/1612_1 /TAXON_ID=37642 ORGANISM="Paraphysomonas imperforata, Strain PA2" /NCGR_SAMPLE_ID=MMETSP0103 /ASSEMBLY_ACC=CAM_ASM_000201 /LENGTH=187 /DNA_ID=CAMNT_0001583027 /DNA_START=244 /DNA_END=807 /DNA_ORIENTATION=+
MKAKKNLEKKREELKKARLLREEETRARKEKVRQDEEAALNEALKSLQTKSLSEEERHAEEIKLKQSVRTGGRCRGGSNIVLSEAAETEILQNLANAYLGNEDDDESEEQEQDVVANVMVAEENRDTTGVMTALFVPAESAGIQETSERSNPSSEVVAPDIDIDMDDIDLNFEQSTEALDQSPLSLS